MATAALPANLRLDQQAGPEQLPYPTLSPRSSSPSTSPDRWQEISSTLTRLPSAARRQSWNRRLSSTSSNNVSATNSAAVFHPSTPLKKSSQDHSKPLPQLRHPETDLRTPLVWASDSAEDFSFGMPNNPAALDCVFDDNQILDAFAQGFSSPSSYPSFLDTASGASTRSRTHQGLGSPARRRDAPARRNSACLDFSSSPLEPTAQSAIDSQNSPNATNNSHPAHHDSVSDSADASDMPPFVSAEASWPATSTRAPKRRRTSVARTRRSQAETLALPFPPDDDDVFADLEASSVKPAGVKGEAEDITTLDLTNTNEVLEDLKKPKVDNRIKISNFQCAICMDDVTTLTVTHCGHLFCQQCLHSALNTGATKGKCPMCRAKIDMKLREAYRAQTKGFWPLELKLMTSNRKGKRKAGSSPPRG